MEKNLFIGDAGRNAINHFFHEEDKDKIKDIYWLKVSHHGSIYNMNSYTINHLILKKNLYFNRKS